MSQLTQFIPGGGAGFVDTITGNAGGAVGPDGAANIDFTGAAGQITVTGNPGANTLVASITNGANGQLLIGGGAAATWGDLTSASGTITFVTGANTLDLNAAGIVAVSFDTDSGTATPALGVLTIAGGVGVTTSGAGSVVTINAGGVDQINIYYVGKHGNDANDGLTIEKAFLTFGAAISAASSGDVVWCSDNGTYTEDLTGVAGIDIYAPNAVLSGEHAITQDNNWTFGGMTVATGATGVVMNSAGNTAMVNVKRVVSSGSGTAFVNAAGKLFVHAGDSIVENGFFVGSVTSDETYISFDEIIFTGTGTAFSTTGGGILKAHGTGVENNGGNGTLFFTAGGGAPDLNATITYVSLDILSDITAGSDVRLNCGSMKGALAESGAGTVMVGGATRIDEVPIGAVTPSTGAFTTLTATTPIDVPSGGTGAATLTDHGILLGSGVGAITALGAATDGQLPIGSTGLDAVLGNITSATDLTVTNGAGTINIDLTADTNITAVHGWNGSLIETASVTVTAAAGTITLSIEKFGTGNLTAIFSDGFDTWVTAPDTVTLTAGSDISPTLNFVYYLQSTKTLTASTVGWPATEFAAVAEVLCQSAASLQTDGAYKVHVWTDHVTSDVDQGHISMLSRWIRQQNATWKSGIAQTLTITPNGGAPDNVIFTSSSGIVYQLHEHAFPAFGGTPDVYTVNDSGTAYNVVTDLNALLTDSTGASMSGKYFSLVIWGVQSEDGADCKLMVNLPGGSYNTQSGLDADADKFADFDIPQDFKGTGFLIYQMNLKHSVAASGTWTSISNIDLRGLFPSLAAGGGTVCATEFPDNAFRIFDDGDSTKEIAFEASAITTATTRTITMDDRNIDMDAVPDSFPTDSGTGTPAAGVLTISGGVGVSTSASGSTITISAPDSGVTWTETTGTTQALAVNNGYILNNAGLVTATLPAVAAIGDVIEIRGKGAGGWLIAQNAGQTIHFISSDTTTGAGGSVASTVRYDALTLTCITANTDFSVSGPAGNFTIV